MDSIVRYSSLTDARKGVAMSRQGCSATRRTYRGMTMILKLEEVYLADKSGRPMTQLARELGIRINQIGKWTKKREKKQETTF